jgi:integrase
MNNPETWKPETWVAIYAAVIGTSAFMLNLKAWWDSGPKLRINLMLDGMTIGNPALDEKNLIIVTVTNRGGATTMVTNLCLFEMPTLWRWLLLPTWWSWLLLLTRWRWAWLFRPLKNYIIPNPQLKGYPPNVPGELEPAKKWTGALRQRTDVTYLPGIPHSDDFLRRYAAALEGVKVQATTIGSVRTVIGSFDALIVSYYKSPEFHALKTSTQGVRRRIIEAFRKDHGTKPVALLTRNHIKTIIGAKSDVPEAANNLLKVLRVLLAFAIEQGMIESNPCIGVKRYKSQGDGFHVWSEGEVAQFESRHPGGSKARLALALALYTAQRVSDLHRMGWQHVQGDRIAVRQEKTKTPLLIKMHPELLRVLRGVPKTNLTFLLTPSGKPYSAQTLSQWFGKQCRLAGLRSRSAHGLRKLATTRLANAGASNEQIKSHTGHKTHKEVDRYTKAANQSLLNDQALALQLRAEAEQKTAQPGNGLCKEDEKA